MSLSRTARTEGTSRRSLGAKSFVEVVLLNILSAFAEDYVC